MSDELKQFLKDVAEQNLGRLSVRAKTLLEPSSPAADESAKPTPFLWFVSDDPDADGWCVHKQSEAKDCEQDGWDVIALYTHPATVASKEAVTLSDKDHFVKVCFNFGIEARVAANMWTLFAQRDASKAEPTS